MLPLKFQRIINFFSYIKVISVKNLSFLFYIMIALVSMVSKVLSSSKTLQFKNYLIGRT